MFQSTHSLRSATILLSTFSLGYMVSIHALLAECDLNGQLQPIFCEPVSIHALLAECDPPCQRYKIVIQSFNPRTPCGVRLGFLALLTIHHEFQSTHSLRSATVPDMEEYHIERVSIHALLAECDSTTAR